jgi:ribose/xylose/arabinose/galactoside ABC-type transport system permease subunit
VDVRARYEIYRALEKAAEQGSAIIFTSSDASELRVLADRVVVLARGREVVRLHAEDVTEQAIVHAFSTATRAADKQAAAMPAPVEHTGPVRMWRGIRSRAWAANLAILVSVIVALAIFASVQYDGFASVSNISSILTLCVPVALVAVAQMSVLLVGEIDASLGAVMGLVVVVLSYFPHLPLVLMVLIALVVGGLLGALNGLLVVVAKVSAVITTIATLGVYTGIALLLRPTPEGLINIDLQTVVRSSIGWLPWTFIGVVVICVAADLWITRTRRGLSSRATGYSAERARRLGVRTDRNRALAYIIAGVIAGLGGFWLAGLTGVGDASVGSGYTLLSLAVPVIGGTLLSGGRASAIGCLAGAVFIAEVQNFVPFVSLPSGAYLVAIGALTLVTLVLASMRGRRRSAFL